LSRAGDGTRLGFLPPYAFALTPLSLQKGALDLTGAARIVLRDWNTGKFARFTTPPSTPPPNATAINVSSHGAGSVTFTTKFYAEDDAILMALSTRKEMRKKGGLVKVSSGSIEERKVAMAQNWVVLEASEGENADSDHGGGSHEDGVATNDDAEEEDDVSGEDDHDSQSDSRTSIGEEVGVATLLPVLSSRKQKRKRGQEHFTSLPSSKKVSLDPATVVSVKGKREIGPTRSILKKPSARVVDRDSSKNDRKVANVKQLKKASTVFTGKKGANEPEAYEFGKFF
jgi:nuclear GTP-binding protein